MERIYHYKGIRLRFRTSLAPTGNKYYTVFCADYRLYEDYDNATETPLNMHEHPKGDITGFVYYTTADDSEAGAIYYANSVIDNALDRALS